MTHFPIVAIMALTDVRLPEEGQTVFALLAEWGPRQSLLGLLGIVVITVLIAMLAASRTGGHAQ